MVVSAPSLEELAVVKLEDGNGIWINAATEWLTSLDLNYGIFPVDWLTMDSVSSDESHRVLGPECKESIEDVSVHAVVWDFSRERSSHNRFCYYILPTTIKQHFFLITVYSMRYLKKPTLILKVCPIFSLATSITKQSSWDYFVFLSHTFAFLGLSYYFSLFSLN